MNNLSTFLRESATARFFIPAGFLLIIFGIVVFVITWNNQNYKKTTATVTNVEIAQERYQESNGNQVEETYNVTIKYTVKEKEYEETLEDVSKYKVGEKITIYYNPKNPKQITQTKSLVLPIAIIIGGIASLIGGIISAMNAIKRNKKMKEQERSWAK